MTQQEDNIDRKQQLGLWLSLMPADRKPNTLAKLATMMGVAVNTLSAWKRDPIVESVRRNSEKFFISSRITFQALKQLEEGINEGKPWAVREGLRVSGLTKGDNKDVSPTEIKVEIMAPKEKDADKA